MWCGRALDLAGVKSQVGSLSEGEGQKGKGGWGFGKFARSSQPPIRGGPRWAIDSSLCTAAHNLGFSYLQKPSPHPFPFIRRRGPRSPVLDAGRKGRH